MKFPDFNVKQVDARESSHHYLALNVNETLLNDSSSALRRTSHAPFWLSAFAEPAKLISAVQKDASCHRRRLRYCMLAVIRAEK